MGTLYIVATPIGNLEDLTFRALRILKEVNLIACEDTRHTRVLLEHYKIKKPLVSFHQHSKLQKIQFLITELSSGKDIALVSDAGTPGLADPAGVLIDEAIKSKIKVEPIPGASALTALIAVAGMPVEKFIFLGFLPKKKGREKLQKFIAQSEIPVVFFESPNRILKTLRELAPILGGRPVVVGRELTKKFEEIYRDEISTILPQIRPQGEFVILIGK